jgi:hypothetical protein
MNQDDRGPWYLLTGLVIGIALGLGFAWAVSPVEYIDTSPASLRADFKDQYRALVAVAYLASGNTERARKRLVELKDGDLIGNLSLQAQAWQALGHPESEGKALGLLAASFIQGPTPTSNLAAATPTSAAPTSDLSPTPVIILTSALDITNTPTPQTGRTPSPTMTITPLPSRTPTPTPGSAFVLQNQQLVCDSSLTQPYIQVDVLDAAGQPVPGVEIVVRWDNGEEHFFTGLKPEMGLGYADFTMTPGVTYTLQLVLGSQPVNGLTPTECEAPGAGRIWGSWRLTFQQP